MIKADFSNEQIISCGYTEEEIKKAENTLYANAKQLLKVTIKTGYSII